MRAAAIHGTLGALALTAATLATGTPAAADQPRPAATTAEQGTAVAAAEAAAAGVDWKECPPREHLPAPAECGTVRVPVDYSQPQGEHLDLTVSRKRAQPTGGKGARLGSLVYNPGGPGASGMRFALYGDVLGGVWKKLNRRWDLVGYAPRGVGRSAPLSCQDPKRFTAAPNPSPRRPSAEYKEQRKERAASYAKGCAQAQGKRLAHYTTEENARDLDVLRAALGERKLSFFGVSYGTYLGAVYASLFPGHVHRLVLDSVVDPTPSNIWYRSNLRQNVAFEQRWNDWKHWTAKHHRSYGLGRDAQQVQRSFDEVRDAVGKKPAGGEVGPKELLAAYLRTGYADSVWAEHAEALAEFRRGRPGPLEALAAPDPARAAEEENGQAVYNAVECADARWPRDWSRWDRDTTASDAVAPFSSWENTWMNLPCAYWPATPRTGPPRVGTDPGQLPGVLLLAGTRDAATPYAGALETQRRLPGSSLVTEAGSGTHGVAGGNACVDRHLAAYLLDGRTPGMRAECEGRPAPEPGA